MKKQQHILTLIIVLTVIGIAVVIASIIYDEKIRDNKKAVETISVPENEEKVEESLPIDDLMKEQKSPVEEELKKINILEVTPMDAMNILYQLKEKIK